MRIDNTYAEYIKDTIDIIDSDLKPLKDESNIEPSGNTYVLEQNDKNYICIDPLFYHPTGFFLKTGNRKEFFLW